MITYPRTEGGEMTEDARESALDYLENPGAENSVEEDAQQSCGKGEDRSAVTHAPGIPRSGVHVVPAGQYEVRDEISSFDIWLLHNLLDRLAALLRDIEHEFSGLSDMGYFVDTDYIRFEIRRWDTIILESRTYLMTGNLRGFARNVLRCSTGLHRFNAGHLACSNLWHASNVYRELVILSASLAASIRHHGAHIAAKALREKQ